MMIGILSVGCVVGFVRVRTVPITYRSESFTADMDCGEQTGVAPVNTKNELTRNKEEK